MRYLVAVAAALAVLCFGCVALVGDPLGTEYTVYIDPTFNLDQQGQILAAMVKWTSAVPVQLSPVIGACSGVHDHEICIHAAEPATIEGIAKADGLAGITIWKKTLDLRHIDGGETYLDVTLDAEEFGVVACHELGHGQGLVHTGAGSLMFPTYGPDQAPAPTEVDTAQWRSLRSR